MALLTRAELHEISQRRSQQDLLDLLPRVDELLDLLDEHDLLPKVDETENIVVWPEELEAAAAAGETPVAPVVEPDGAPAAKKPAAKSKPKA